MTLLTPNLTRPQGDALAKQQDDSVPGMAFWAGSGPDGRTCRECAFWGGDKHRRYASWLPEGGYLKPHRCIKFKRLASGRTGPGIADDLKACKYFEPRENPPPQYFKRGASPQQEGEA